MADDNSVQLKFSAIGLDQVKAASAGLVDYQNQLKGAKSEEDKLASGGNNLNNSLNDINSFFDNIDFTSDFKELRDGLQGAKTDADELKDSLTGVGEAAQSSGEAPGTAAFRRTGGALNQIGLSDAGRGLQFAGDLQQIDKFKGEIAGIPPTMAAAGIAVVGLTAVIDIYARQTELAKQAAQAEITARQSAIELVATGTKEQQQAKLNELEATRKGNQAIADDTNNLYANLVKQIDEKMGLAAAGVEINLAKIGKADGTFQAVYDSVQKANKAVDDTSTEMNILTQATGLTAQTTEQAAAAQLQYNQSLKLGAEIIMGVETPLQKAKEVNDFLATATTKQLEDKKKAAEADVELTASEIVGLVERRKALDDNSQAAKDVDVELDKLRDTQFGQLAVIVQLNDATSALTAAQNDAAKEQADIRSQQVASTQKYSQEILKLDDDKNKSLADAASKYNDTLVSIADQAAKSAEQALEKLKEKRDDLSASFANTEADAYQAEQYKQLDDQKKFAEEQAKAARDHANELLKIDRDFTQKEADAALNRDFASLYALQQQKTTALNDANSAYNQQQADRIAAFVQQEQDEDTNYARQEQARQLNYQRQQQQAQLAYTREQAAIAKNYNDGLSKALSAYTNEQNLIQQKYQNQLTQQQQAISAELQLEAQGNAGKLALEAQYYAQSQALIQGMLSNGGSTSAGAQGNVGFGSGQNGLSSLDIPRATNISSGSVSNTSNNKNVSFSLTQVISGGRDEAKLAAMAKKAAKEIFIEAVGA